MFYSLLAEKIREKLNVCQNNKPQPFLDTKRKRKQTKPNKCKSNKRTKSTKICSLFLKRGNRNAKKTEKHKNKITQGKTIRLVNWTTKQQIVRLAPRPRP